MNNETPSRLLALHCSTSLAKLFHEYSDRWEIERVERSTEWVAVLRETGGEYICIVGAHDLDALRYKMDEVDERDEPEERETNGAQ